MPVFTTDLDTTRVSLDVDSRIADYHPSASPFVTILTKSKKVKTKNHQVNWYEDENGARITQVNAGAGYTYDAAVITVDNADIFVITDLVKVPRTGETMRVVAVDRTLEQITVIRDYGGTRSSSSPTGYALVDNDYLMCMANAQKEGSHAPDAKLGQPVKKYNYCQIVRTPWDVTGTVDAEEVVTNETERTRLSRRKTKEHLIDLERCVIFGERAEHTSGGQIVRTMGGLEQFLTTNVLDVNGVLYENTFERTFLEAIFAAGGDKRLGIFSPRLINIISGWNKPHVVAERSDKTYGVTITKYVSSYGELFMVPSQLLTGYYAGWGFVCDIENIQYNPLRDTKLNRNIQDNDEDCIRDEYFTEATIKVKLEKNGGVIKRVTG